MPVLFVGSSKVGQILVPPAHETRSESRNSDAVSTVRQEPHRVL